LLFISLIETKGILKSEEDLSSFREILFVEEESFLLIFFGVAGKREDGNGRLTGEKGGPFPSSHLELSAGERHKEGRQLDSPLFSQYSFMFSAQPTNHLTYGPKRNLRTFRSFFMCRS
jgi:hypothetical protein